jgi:hypothetical protein
MMGPIDRPKRNIATGRRLWVGEMPNSSTKLLEIGAAALEHITIQVVSRHLRNV